MRIKTKKTQRMVIISDYVRDIGFKLCSRYWFRIMFEILVSVYVRDLPITDKIINHTVFYWVFKLQFYRLII